MAGALLEEHVPGAFIVTSGTHVPILYVHARVDAGATLEFDVPSDTNAFAYVLAGAGEFGPDARAARRAQLVAFGPSGDTVSIRGGAEALEVIVLAGRAPARAGRALRTVRDEHQVGDRRGLRRLPIGPDGANNAFVAPER